MSLPQSGEALAEDPAIRPNDLSVEPATPASRRYAHYVLLMLCLANTLSVLDRGMVSLLLEPMKADLRATDTEMSLLTGAAFVIFYSLFGIPIARWADRGNRRRLLAIGVALWSLASGASGLAQNFAQMAVTRAAAGVGEAAGIPTTMSLIADYYRREVRPQVVAVFNIAVQLGTIAIIPALGYLAQTHGWRAVMLVLAVPGVLIALLVEFTILEPKRGATDPGGGQGLAQATLRHARAVMWRSRPFMLLLLGTAIVGLGVGTLGAWGNAVMMRVFHVTPMQIAGVFAPIGAASMFSGMVAGGAITSWAVKRTGDQRMVLLLSAIASLVAVPGGLLYAFGSTWAWTIVGGVLGGISIGFRTPVHQALMLELVPANCRGMAAAAALIASSVVGQAGGPLVVGMISDYLAPSLGVIVALRRALIFAPVTLLLGCIPFFMALRYFDRSGLKAEWDPSGPTVQGGVVA